MAKTPFSVDGLTFDRGGPPRYEQLAAFVRQAIADGRLAPGERLPTVRQIATALGVSPTMVSSAFNLLAERGLIHPEVGRGTFVREPPRAEPVASPAWAPRAPELLGRAVPVPWRRRLLMSCSARLRAAYPDALECATGRPDPALLPLDVLRRAWKAAMSEAAPRDLQYAGPEAIQPLADRLVPLLESDDVPARAQDLLIGSSAQQFMVLALELAAARGTEPPVVAVEEPGYPTIFDTFERAGARLVGVDVDGYGAVPASLDAALRGGARAALFTPRGHNPTGASWSRERAAALAGVLAAHRDVLVIEDDQFAGIATTRVGSLLSDPRLESRTIYIRSFSKSVAPDLRVAVAVARAGSREFLLDAKSFSDGWTSRLLQRVMAEALGDGELPAALDRARDEYRARRETAAAAVNEILLPHGGGAWCGPDGVNLWVHLPPGVDAREAVERSAAAGVQVADGGAFFIAPGHDSMVRLNAGSVPATLTGKAGRLLGESALACARRGAGPIHV